MCLFPGYCAFFRVSSTGQPAEFCLFPGYCAKIFYWHILPIVPTSNKGTITRSSAQLARKTAENLVSVRAPEPAEDKRIITMSNALTRAAHGLTLGEKRIIGMAVATLNPKAALRPGEVPTTRIMAADYAETFDLDPNTAYEQLQDAAKHLFERKITFYQAAHRRSGKPLPPTRVQMRWVGRAAYQQGEGWIEVAWWPELLPHLTGLKKQFTSYQLQQTSALRSVYSWKLLELLMRFEATGWAEYTIEDFAEAMEATEKQRENFAAIRRKIIEPAVAELVEKDGWLIDWKPMKAGRRVKAVRFDFRRNPQGLLL